MYMMLRSLFLTEDSPKTGSKYLIFFSNRIELGMYKTTNGIVVCNLSSSRMELSSIMEFLLFFFFFFFFFFFLYAHK